MRKIYILGDSTTQEYDEKDFPQQGWAHYVKDVFDLEVINVAKAGNTLKSFIYSEDYQAHKCNENDISKSEWGQILTKLNKDDFMIIYWGGINDKLRKYGDCYIECKNGDYVPDINAFQEEYPYMGKGLGTHRFFTLSSQIDEFIEIFCKMIEQVKVIGAIPIIVKGTGKYYPIHNNDKNVLSVVRDFSEATREIAAMTNCSFIDVGSEFEEEFALIGYKNMIDKYFLNRAVFERFSRVKKLQRPMIDGEDNVHYNEDGAKHIAEIFIKKLKNSNIELSKYLLSE